MIRKKLVLLILPLIFNNYLFSSNSLEQFTELASNQASKVTENFQKYLEEINKITEAEDKKKPANAPPIELTDPSITPSPYPTFSNFEQINIRKNQ